MKIHKTAFLHIANIYIYMSKCAFRNNENRQQINKQINQKFWAILTKSNKITSIFPSE